jgi:hypothetical protein
MPKTSCNTEHLNADQIEDHLTENQIDDHLIGDLAPAAASHLAICEHCAALVAAAAAPIANFQAVTQAWSERRSATMPVYVPATSQPHVLALRIAAGATAAVILMMGVTVPSSRRQAPSQSAYAQPQTVLQPQALAEVASATPPTSPQEQMRRSNASNRISQDNQMLEDIDAALNASSESSSLGLEAVSADQSQQPAAASLQD